MPLPAYFDTSALVKLYLQESFSVETERIYLGSAAVACHEIGFVEVRAALAQAARSSRIETEAHRALVDDFVRDWESGISFVATDAALLHRAADLAEGFALRGYDAIHLASAERILRALPGTVFMSFDRTLNRAAKLLGFSLPDFIPT